MATAEARPQGSAQAPAKLIRFFLQQFSLKNYLLAAGGVGEMTVTISHKGKVDLIAPTASFKSCRAKVILDFHVKGIKGNDAKPSLVVNSSYQARFRLPKDLSVAAATKLLKSRKYSEELILRIIPLGISHIKSQLDASGVTHENIPYEP